MFDFKFMLSPEYQAQCDRLDKIVKGLVKERGHTSVLVESAFREGYEAGNNAANADSMGTMTDDQDEDPSWIDSGAYNGEINKFFSNTLIPSTSHERSPMG